MTFLPPLDVHWVWHVHMLAPMNYHQDLSQSPLGRIINHQPINPQSQEAIGKRKQTAFKWIETFPDIPFELSLTEENSFHGEFSSKLSYNIIAASERQKVFFYQVKQSILILNVYKGPKQIIHLISSIWVKVMALFLHILI